MTNRIKDPIDKKLEQITDALKFIALDQELSDVEAVRVIAILDNVNFLRKDYLSSKLKKIQKQETN